MNERTFNFRYHFPLDKAGQLTVVQLVPSFYSDNEAYELAWNILDEALVTMLKRLIRNKSSLFPITNVRLTSCQYLDYITGVF